MYAMLNKLFFSSKHKQHVLVRSNLVSGNLPNLPDRFNYASKKQAYFLVCSMPAHNMHAISTEIAHLQTMHGQYEYYIIFSRYLSQTHVTYQ